jgi:uncharacterized membrane protein
MTWKQRYQLRSYLRSSLWIIPIGAVVLHLLAARVVHFIDARLDWSGAHVSVEGAKTLCSTVITLALSCIVFTFGSLLVAIQVASGQYTPRIIATTLLRDDVIRYTVGLFVLSGLFALKAFYRIDTHVPQLVVLITAILGLLTLVAFLYLIDYAARLLRPVSLTKRVGDAGLAVLKSVYPEMLASGKDAAASVPDVGPAERTILHTGVSGIVVAVDLPQLIAEAEKAGGVIEFAPYVGDFVGMEEPLFFLRGGATAVADKVLRDCVIFGSERTVEQDPLFAFRILVDIAIKALSAAINDPTTAVLAVDQLQRLMRSAGRRNLRADFIYCSAGSLRVVFRTPDWHDFVNLTFAEIRFYGASNLQIARRLRAMIINLANTLPAERHAALRQEFDLLDRSLEKLYVFPEDLALARIPDAQGLGGSTDTVAPKWAT